MRRWPAVAGLAPLLLALLLMALGCVRADDREGLGRTFSVEAQTGGAWQLLGEARLDLAAPSLRSPPAAPITALRLDRRLSLRTGCSGAGALPGELVVWVQDGEPVAWEAAVAACVPAVAARLRWQPLAEGPRPLRAEPPPPQPAQQPQRAWYQSWWVYLIPVLLVFLLGGGGAGGR